MIIAALAMILFACLAGALLWSLTVHAMPLWCGALAALAANHAGAGLIGAFLAGIGAATGALVLGHGLVAAARTPAARAAVGLIFALPAAVAGFYAASGVATAFGLGGWEQSVITVLGVAATGISAWGGALGSHRRPRPARPGGV